MTALETATAETATTVQEGLLRDVEGAPAYGDGAAALRRQAAERFLAAGLPTTKNEDWHFTSVAQIAEQDFLALTAPGGEVTPAQVATLGFGEAGWHTAVFVNGRFSAELSSLAALPAGVRVLPLAEAFRAMPEVVARHLGKVARIDDAAAAFQALNGAWLLDGAVVHVAKEVDVAEPIHLLFVSDAAAARGAMYPRVLVVADRHAKATVIESYAATGDATYLVNAVTEVVVGEGATLHHLRLQRESARAFHVGTVEATQARDSHYVNFSWATGAQLSRINVYAHLNGEGCGATLNGLYMLDGDQHCDHQTLIEHVEPNCYSRELYKGVLDGTSHGVFNGKVYVHPAAQKTDGKQTNNVLLLSPRAQVDAKPQLEIFADDVKCTHGATIGRIDQASAFYMKSRGISAERAQRLLTYAFAADVIETLEVDAVKRGLEEMTLARFAGGE